MHEALASITSNSVSAIAAISSNQGNNTAGNNNSNNNNSNNSNSTTISNINLPGSRSQSVSGFNSPYFEQKSFEANYFDDSRRGSDYSEILLNSCLSSYEYTTNAAGAGQATGGGVGGFDSSTGFQIFPSMSTPAKDELNNNTNNNKETSSVQSTLPLKRLKSLKNGIRKLSLTSKSAPTTNLSTPVPLSRPILSPIQTTSSSNQQIPVQHQHSNNSTSADNSSTNSSDFSNLMNPIILSKRSRAFSGSAISTPTTPPLQSPVITLSENLTNSRKSLLCIEHSYFDSLNQAKGVSTTKSSSLSRSENDTDNDNDHDIENEDNDISPVYSVSELSKPSELIDYFMFLKEQKNQLLMHLKQQERN